MDIATLIGIFSGISLVVYAIVRGADPIVFIDINSMIIVFGGTAAATFTNFPLKDVIRVLGVLKKAFFNSAPVFQHKLERIVDLAIKARREGILALETEMEHEEEEFLIKGIQLAVDGTEPEMIKAILGAELSNTEERHSLGASIMRAMGTYAPALGMIGTLIGLIQMLSAMEDPSQIGSGMAVALITTFYGAMLANLIFLPIAGKLETISTQEVLQMEMILEGILSIQQGDNPRMIQEKLISFIPPNFRAEILNANTGGGL
ncbi:MAG: motility protein A [Candidatus Marinimicrobia bacterium]|nr:motility protein A [Candidatus Neomarinimicrobiota bacterium]